MLRILTVVLALGLTAPVGEARADLSDLGKRMIGSWDCVTEGSRGPNLNFITYNADGTYTQRAVWHRFRADGQLTARLHSHGTWSLDGRVLSDTTTQASLDDLTLDGAPASQAEVDAYRAHLDSYYPDRTDYAMVLYATPSTYSQMFFGNDLPWVCERVGLPATS